jgi:hypothetical protein
MAFVMLSEQVALWTEWYKDRFNEVGGAIPDWETRLMIWDRAKPLDADLWVRLLEWKKAKDVKK